MMIFLRRYSAMLALVTAMTSRILLLLASSAITLLLLECVTRFFYPQPINHYNFTLLQAEGGGDMVLGSIRSTNGDRLKGYGPYIPNLSTSFGGVEVSINSRGWRDSEYSLEKPRGVTRILVVGDSITFGHGVQSRDVFAKVLEQELNRNIIGSYQVLSLGGAGATTYSQKNSIRDNVRIYAPDLVILAFNINDIMPKIFGTKNAPARDVRRSISRTVLNLRKTLDARFRSRSHLYFLFREKMKVILRKFAIASPTGVPLPAFDIESDYGLSAWRDTREALREIADELQKDQVRFLLAILPVEMQMSAKIADIYRSEYGFVFADSLVDGKPQEIIADFARQYAITCVDLLPAFREDPGEKKFFRIYGGSIDWNHPTPLGHKIIAEELKKALNSLGWLRVLNRNGGRETGLL